LSEPHQGTGGRRNQRRGQAVELSSGAVAHVSNGCPPEALDALNTMAEYAKKAAEEGKL